MKKKGITLIALIITIVVLLILAGVTMSFVVGDNGVVTQAQKSRIRTDQVSAKEEIDLEVAGSYDYDGHLDLELLNENLMKNLKGLQLKKNGTTGDKDEDFEEFNNDTVKIERLPATVRYKGVNVKINEKKLISDLASNPENYGMYVDYPIKLSGNQDTINDWRIFYEDKTGRVFLIAADYVPNTCSALKKEDGSLIAGMKLINSTDENFKKCCYSLSSLDYTCNDGHNKNLNNNKSQCSFPEIFMPSGDFCSSTNHYYCSDHTTNSNSRCVSQLQCTSEWKNFVNRSYADYAIGGPTLEMWVASWNGKHGSETEESGKTGKTLYADGCNNTGNGYKIGENSDSTRLGIQLKGCGGYEDTLYFPHNEYQNLDLFDDNKKVSKDKLEEDSENASCYGYWLASPSAYSMFASCLMCVNYGGDVNNDVSYRRFSSDCFSKIWSLC